MAGPWKWFIVDPAGIRRGRLRRGRDLSVLRHKGPCRPDAATVKLPQDDRLVQYVDAHRSYLQGYRDGVLRFHGRIGGVHDSFNADGNEWCTFGAVDALYMIGRRTRQSSLEIDPAEPMNDIVKQLVDDENARWFTGLRTDTVALATLAELAITLERDKPVLEAARDMAIGLNGFDVWADAAKDDNDHTVLGDLRVEQQRGEIRESIAFEYAVGKRNLLSLEHHEMVERHTTDQHVIGRDEDGSVARSDIEANTDAREYYDAIFDSVDALPDVSVLALLDTYAEQLQAWRAFPRRLITAELDPTTSYAPYDDYDVGDYVPVRIDRGRLSGARAIKGHVRLYGYRIGIDSETGDERVTDLALEPEDQGGGIA